MKIKDKMFLIPAGCILIIAFMYSIWRVFFIPTGAMEPTIPKGSKLISQRYVFSSPKRGDVVIFSTENIKYGDSGLMGKNYIKRLIGLPGDTVEIKKGKLIINSVEYESEIYYTIPKPYESPYINSQRPVIMIPADHYFVLGDNSENSLDSRYFGPIPAQNIWARMIYLLK